MLDTDPSFFSKAQTVIGSRQIALLEEGGVRSINLPCIGMVTGKGKRTSLIEDF